MFGQLVAKLLVPLRNRIFLYATKQELMEFSGLTEIGLAVAVAKLTKCGILRVDAKADGFPKGTKCYHIDAHWLDELVAGSTQPRELLNSITNQRKEHDNN